MRIASRWAKTGSLLRCWAIPSTHGSMYCGLGISRPRAAAAAYATGLYGRLYGIRLYFAVFRCMTLYTCITHRHAFPPAPYSHTAPYSAIQRCMSIQLYSTIQHTAHTTPLRAAQGAPVGLRPRLAGCRRARHRRRQPRRSAGAPHLRGRQLGAERRVR